MPATSLKQKKFMDAVAHNPAFAKQVGVPQSVGKDFSEASKGMQFGKGSSNRADLQSINKPKTNQGSQELFKKGGSAMATKKMMAFEKSGKDVEKKGVKEGSKADMAMDKKQMASMKRGGGVKKMASGGDTTMTNKSKERSGITAEKMAPVRTAAPSKDGIASKGKTKGMQVKMSSSSPLGMKKGGKVYR